MNRQIVHLDLDSFYVNCTVLKMPELAKKPLIIGGTSSRGVVMSASEEATRYGVKKSMPTRLALRLCPDAVVLKGDFDLFSNYSDTVNEIITEKAPVHERAHMDQFYLDMTGMDRFFGSLQFSQELSQTIKKETGLPLQLGLSVNKTVAKMCTPFARNTGFMAVPQNEVLPFMDPQSIRNIPYLGDVTYRFLRRISIKYIRTLRQVPQHSMKELLGKNGTTLWRKANGDDPTPVVPYDHKKAISMEKTFDKDTQDLPNLKSLIISMVENVAFQMREAHLMCATVTIRIRYSNLDTETKQKKVAFTASDDTLIKVALDLFDQLYKRRMLLRLVGVKLTNFVYGNHQIDLFQDNIKKIRLYEAMDRMKTRYQDPQIIRRAIGFSAYELSNQ